MLDDVLSAVREASASGGDGQDPVPAEDADEAAGRLVLKALERFSVRVKTVIGQHWQGERPVSPAPGPTGHSGTMTAEPRTQRLLLTQVLAHRDHLPVHHQHRPPVRELAPQSHPDRAPGNRLDLEPGCCLRRPPENDVNAVHGPLGRF